MHMGLSVRKEKKRPERVASLSVACRARGLVAAAAIHSYRLARARQTNLEELGGSLGARGLGRRPHIQVGCLEGDAVDGRGAAVLQRAGVGELGALNNLPEGVGTPSIIFKFRHLWERQRPRGGPGTAGAAPRRHAWPPAACATRAATGHACIGRAEALQLPSSAGSPSSP